MKAQENEPTHIPHCSFCGKTQNDAVELVAGPSIFICDECIKVCVDILADERRPRLIARQISQRM